MSRLIWFVDGYDANFAYKGPSRGWPPEPPSLEPRLFLSSTPSPSNSYSGAAKGPSTTDFIVINRLCQLQTGCTPSASPASSFLVRDTCSHVSRIAHSVLVPFRHYVGVCAHRLGRQRKLCCPNLQIHHHHLQSLLL